MRNQFDTCLPHSKTLSKWYKTVDAQPGFCTEALNAIKLYCNANDGPIVTSLIVDSMSIKQDVKWDGTKYVGYVNFGIDLNDSIQAFGTKKALNEGNYEETKEFFGEMVTYIKTLKNSTGVPLIKSNRKTGIRKTCGTKGQIPIF